MEKLNYHETIMEGCLKAEGTYRPCGGKLYDPQRTGCGKVRELGLL